MLDKNNVTSYLLTKGWYQDYTRLEWWHLHNEPRQHPPPNRNDSDDLGLGDGVYYGGVNYHGLVSLLFIIRSMRAIVIQPTMTQLMLLPH